MDRENLAENLERMTVGLDDSFRFHCTQCGKCCKHRADIILSPHDIFKMAQNLHMAVPNFLGSYCISHIGDTSRIPITRLRPEGNELRCPMLKNNRCIVQAAKPAVCALFPLGRYVAIKLDPETLEPKTAGDVRYLLQDIQCGDNSQSHTVRDWLSDFNIPLEDENFLRWHQTIARLGTMVRQLEQTQDAFTMLQVFYMIRLNLYIRYDIAQPFLTQFDANLKELYELLEDIPRLKKAVRDAAGAL